jgi:NAD-dependent DNA ligase
MDTTAPTPSWLVGMLVIFSLAAAAVFGLFLYRHAEATTLSEQHALLASQLEPLRLQAAAHEDAIKPLETQIVQRRALLQPIDGYESTNRADVDRALTNNGATLKANEVLQSKALGAFADAMKEAPERRQEVGREEERAFATERDNDDRLLQLREDVAKQSQTLEDQKKKWRGEKTVLEDRIAELEGRLRQLTNQLDSSNREFKVDGEILASEAKDGFVVIDRGFVHQLRSGTKFTVFSKRGGKVVVKGQLQVTDVKERISTARVLEERDGNDPLIQGDLLHNPVYDPAHIRSFAIRGDFRRFSRIELARFIQESGGKLDNELSINVDFLVAGANAVADLNQATKLGMSILSEDQLLDFLKYDARPSATTWDYILAACKEGKQFGFAGTFTAVDEGVAKRAIERNGGRTSVGVSQGYAALVVGSGADGETVKAIKLGVPVIDQSQFARIVDPVSK